MRFIAKATLTSNAAELSIANIPQDYKNLYLVSTVFSTSSTISCYLKFNNLTGVVDSAVSYALSGVMGTSTQTSADFLDLKVTNNTRTVMLSLGSYTADRHKGFIFGSGNLTMGFGRVKSTEAINALTLFAEGAGVLAAGTTMTLYGVV